MARFGFRGVVLCILPIFSRLLSNGCVSVIARWYLLVSFRRFLCPYMCVQVQHPHLHLRNFLCTVVAIPISLYLRYLKYLYKYVIWEDTRTHHIFRTSAIFLDSENSRCFDGSSLPNRVYVGRMVFQYTRMIYPMKSSVADHCSISYDCRLYPDPIPVIYPTKAITGHGWLYPILLLVIYIISPYFMVEWCPTVIITINPT